MKERFRLYRRKASGKFYIQDGVTGNPCELLQNMHQLNSACPPPSLSEIHICFSDNRPYDFVLVANRMRSSSACCANFFGLDFFRRARFWIFH